ncbi:MAG: leucyl/phenylalanyl-tRNA--protein transferase [Pedobacter sp.]|nr:MAG: leucyl/phenylalanyl-tRNA--protein transferase [Pedobacter sp.]
MLENVKVNIGKNINGLVHFFVAEDDDTPILWYSPHERCVIFPKDVHVSSSMEKIIRRKTFEIRTNTAFAEVINQCSSIERKGQDGTWIIDRMKSAYIHLHQLGFAESIEVWQNGELVGGMYGVRINRVFCGESMFSKVSNASKMALISLCRSGQYDLLDCQVPNDHLISLGAVMIPQNRFLKLLAADPT